ncbi:MAG: methionyl-tRNA formyltransferase [Anaeromicrobium sp.]|jgi:methionyl-tRNA formyltransferase|uniref:methionyl-tRNA formyltransferase n=1 Tax=Anaeromicrobium sp. TaxID=1929132 RepID=UPI0025ED61EE|nr:methionyl-tRNA formyltransferase [Anaeromicrobium sp.]MCT4594902.1 methionyl-tRNA formyltransferase [Anaeromicrobium sp.]
MRIIFMGTPDFAVPSLDVVGKEHELLAVVTQPDRPKGRGKKLASPPVKERALEYGAQVYQPERVRNEEFINIIKEYNPDCIVVVAFGQILPKELLDIPKFGCINVHASLLPKYRGAAPINWAIINGEKTTGVTTMYMDVGLDTGDMILKSEVEIGNMTAGQLHDVLMVKGATLLRSTLKEISEKKAPREKQRDEESSYAPIMDKKLGEIDWNKTNEHIRNLIRGVNPWPSAYSTYDGIKFKIWNGELQDLDNEKGKNGEILNVSEEGILVKTAKGALLVNEIQFPNSKRMRVDAYLRGNDLKQGIILGE